MAGIMWCTPCRLLAQTYAGSLWLDIRVDRPRLPSFRVFPRLSSMSLDSKEFFKARALSCGLTT
eukprot:55788-Amphidinium_carterae.1